MVHTPSPGPTPLAGRLPSAMLGFWPRVPIAVGSIDAYIGAPGGGSAKKLAGEAPAAAGAAPGATASASAGAASRCTCTCSCTTLVSLTYYKSLLAILFA